MPRRLSFVAMFLLLGLGSVACSGSVDFSFGGQTPADAAVDLIEGEAMAQRLGVAPITGALCQNPVDEQVGTTFSCTADSAGETINFEVLLEEDERIFAGPTNVVDTVALSRLETVAVQSLNSANGFTLPEDAMECGDESVILDSAMQMTCALTDPSTGVVFDALVTVNDTGTGDFNVAIIGEAE